MSSPENMRKQNEPWPTLQPTPNPSLPDDLILSCIARVSRLYYPTLSLVSKGFRSLIASPELYKARSLLGHTESCLYVCIRLFSDHRWFTLCRESDQTLTNDTSKKKKKKSSGYVLATAPIPHSPPANVSGLVAVGSSIYNIGGSIYKPPSSRVSVLDCMSHTWCEAPSLLVELLSLSASVLDQNIYVSGSCKDGDSGSLKNSLQVFDTKTQIWDHVPIPCSESKYTFYDESDCIDGKFHVRAGIDVVAYNSKEGRWDLVEQGMYMDSDSCCEIENVLYSATDSVFRWYDTEVSMWRKLKGLVGLPKFPIDACVKLADYGGKMAVLWEEDYCGPLRGYKKMIWCAEIALER